MMKYLLLTLGDSCLTTIVDNINQSLDLETLSGSPTVHENELHLFRA